MNNFCSIKKKRMDLFLSMRFFICLIKITSAV